MMTIDVEAEVEAHHSIKDVLATGAYGLMYAAHINMFFATAGFDLLMLITVEAFPKNYRYYMKLAFHSCQNPKSPWTFNDFLIG